MQGSSRTLTVLPFYTVHGGRQRAALIVDSVFERARTIDVATTSSNQPCCHFYKLISDVLAKTQVSKWHADHPGEGGAKGGTVDAEDTYCTYPEPIVGPLYLGVDAV